MAQILRRFVPGSFSKYNLIRQFGCGKQPTVPLYKIRLAYPRDYPQIMEFLVDTYFKTEPSILNIGQGLSEQVNPLLIHLMHENIHEGLTMIAEDRGNGCIVGVAVNVNSRKAESDHAVRLAEACDSGPARELVRFFAFCSKQSAIWDKYNVSSVFECAHVAVHPDHTGQGIAKRLVNESWVLARDCAHRVFRIDASSTYTAKIAEGMGMTCVWSYPYRRYLDNGKFVFQNVKKPHTELRIYVDRLTCHTSYYPPAKKS